MLELMETVFRRVCIAQKSELLEFNGETDHVHLLVSTAPDTTPSEVAVHFHFLIFNFTIIKLFNFIVQ